MKDPEEEYSHESYGLVQFSRGFGRHTRLFGSSITNHMTTVTLYIRRGTLHHSLSSDSFYGSLRNDLIEVEMSAAQFSELLTTMNMGSGVPCTIRRFDGERVEDPPDLLTETERVREGFKDKLTGFVRSIKRQKLAINEILEKKSVNKKDRESIRDRVNSLFQEVESNMPFVLEQFNEATDRVVTAGKAEIDSFVTTMINRTGLQQLQQMNQTKLLKEGKEEE